MEELPTWVARVAFLLVQLAAGRQVPHLAEGAKAGRIRVSQRTVEARAAEVDAAHTVVRARAPVGPRRSSQARAHDGRHATAVAGEALMAHPPPPSAGRGRVARGAAEAASLGGGARRRKPSMLTRWLESYSDIKLDRRRARQCKSTAGSISFSTLFSILDLACSTRDTLTTIDQTLILNSPLGFNHHA
eukprot:COSAG01_NODE_537_length_15764_cov_54.273795_12_plen_189_part_00